MTTPIQAAAVEDEAYFLSRFVEGSSFIGVSETKDHIRTLLAAHAETRSKLGLAVKALEEIKTVTFAVRGTAETRAARDRAYELARQTLALIGKEDFSSAQDLHQASGDVTSPGSEGAKP